MGIVSALFVMLLSVSGLVLHYSPAFNFDSRFFASPLLLSWYNIEVPEIASSYTANGRRASLIADALYFEQSRIPGNFNSLVGMVESDFGYAIASSNLLVLISIEGELIEVLGSSVGVPSGILRIGQNLAGITFLERTAELIEADFDALTWTAYPQVDASLTWSAASPVEDQLERSIKQDYAGSLLSWERLVLDIHSGRFLGSIGVILVDLMAILFILMAGTGVWIWSQRRS